MLAEEMRVEYAKCHLKVRRVEVVKNSDKCTDLLIKSTQFHNHSQKTEVNPISKAKIPGSHKNKVETNKIYL